MAGALRAGLNLEEALRVLLEEAPEPLKSHLAEKDRAEKWLPLPARLERLFGAPHLSLARAALLLSYEAGGKAGSLIESAAEVLRQKQEMKEKIATLTAQGRLAAWVVGLSPLGLMAAFQFLSPDFLAPLFATRAGLLLLTLVLILLAAGLFFAHKVAAIEP